MYFVSNWNMARFIGTLGKINGSIGGVTFQGDAAVQQVRLKPSRNFRPSFRSFSASRKFANAAAIWSTLDSFVRSLWSSFGLLQFKPLQSASPTGSKGFNAWIALKNILNLVRDMEESDFQTVENIDVYSFLDFDTSNNPPSKQIQPLGWDGFTDYSFTFEAGNCLVREDGVYSFRIQFNPINGISNLEDVYENEIGFIIWGSTPYRASGQVPRTQFLQVMGYIRPFASCFNVAPGSNCIIRIYSLDNPNYYRMFTKYKAGKWVTFTLGTLSTKGNVYAVTTIEVQIGEA